MALNTGLGQSPSRVNVSTGYNGSLTVAAVQLFLLVMAVPGYFISRSANDGFYVTIVLGIAAMLAPVAVLVGGVALFRNHRQPWDKRKNFILVWFSINLLPVAFYILTGAVFQLFSIGRDKTPVSIPVEEMSSISTYIIS
jgi:hypothetical protein